MSVLVVMAIAGPAPAQAQAPAFWAEGEHWTAQRGSVRPDRPPFGSGHECVGSNFGGAAGHYALYRFRLDREIPDAALVIRYARLADDEAEFSVTMDGGDAGTVRFPPTGGWGHRAASEWAFAAAPLGRLAAGVHALRLTSLKPRSNTNIDGFVLAPSGSAPPETVAELAKLPKLAVDRRDWGMWTDPELSIDDFAPRETDAYYPADEAGEMAGLSVPQIEKLSVDSVVISTGEGRRELWPGDSADGWRLMAVTKRPRAAVLVKRFTDWGLLAYVAHEGITLPVRLPVGNPASARAPREYPARYAETILQSKTDLLAERVLAQGEPSYETTVELLPELVGYVPISSALATRKLVIDEEGRIGPLSGEYGEKRIGEPLFDPAEHVGDLLPTAAKRGLIGGHLPAVHYAFWDAEAKRGWEQIVFALSVEPESVYCALIQGEEWRYFRIGSSCEEADAVTFFEALAAFCGAWKRDLDPQMRVELPEQRLADAPPAALAHAFTTFVGDHPKYGVGYYAGEAHDGFPPTILWMVNACVEWGLFDRAHAYLSYYFEHFVRDEGTFNYYGPAVSEYGQMLDAVARYVRYTGDAEWLASHRAKVNAIAEHLLSLRRESLGQPEDAPTRGLLYGSPEADTRKETDYYFSGTAWACRGLVELARLHRDHGDDALLRRAEELEREAADLRADLMRAARASLIPGDPPFLPPYPGIEAPFPTMTADRLASYTNYRYWPELLSAEVLDDDLADAIFEYRRQMGGELLATTRFSGHLDDWPLAQQARAFIADDRVDQFLLATYGHMALQQMPGTFCAYEQVAITGAGARKYHADYCVPAQLTMPLLVKWMLVYEERDSDTLWLCKAAPRRWFAPRQSLSVRNAPTRWGPVSFRIECEEKRVVAQIIPPPKLEGTILLRIRRPGGELPIRVVAEDQQVELDSEREAVALDEPRAAIAVHLTYE